MSGDLEWEFHRLKSERDDAYQEADKLQRQLDCAIEEIQRCRVLLESLATLVEGILTDIPIPGLKSDPGYKRAMKAIKDIKGYSSRAYQPTGGE